MQEYTADNGVVYRVVRNNRSYFEIAPSTGGVPKELEGLFTNPRIAGQALLAYSLKSARKTKEA